MSDVKLYLFQTGTLKCKYHDIYLNQGEGRDFEIPVPFYVIDTPKAWSSLMVAHLRNVRLTLVGTGALWSTSSSPSSVPVTAA